MAITVVTSKWKFKMKHVTDRERLHEIREHMLESMSFWTVDVFTEMASSHVTMYIMDAYEKDSIDMELEYKAVYKYLSSVDFVESVDKDATYRFDEIHVNPRLELVETNQSHFIVSGVGDVISASL